MKNKGFKVTAIILTLAICIIAHPFSVVKAAMDHAEYNYSGSGSNNGLNYRYDCYIWSNDGTDVEPVTVAGNTLYCNEYTIFEIYFMQPTSGQLRVNRYTGANLADFTFYINGGVFNGKQTAYMNVKFTNVTHLTIILTTYNNAAYADPTKVFSLSNFSLSEPTNTTDSTLNDIDILLQNVDYTLQDILGYINGNNGIIDYLDQIETYSEYLYNISLDLSNIDNTIDTISWNNINISFHGWTSNFSTFDTTENKLYSGGYYQFDNFDIFGNEPRIYKLQIPIKGEPPYTINSFKLYLRSGSNNYNFVLKNYLFEVDKNFLTYYFYFDTGFLYSTNSTTLLVQYQAVGPSSSTRYTYNNYLSLQYIQDSDIEYWTIKNAIDQRLIIEKIDSIVNGSSDTSTATSIDSITSDLNDQITASNSATSSTEALLDNFNQNMNLTDYNFSISTGDHVTYFKQKLTDIYEIDEFKPFYLIPIILFVLGRILAG